MRVRVTWRLPDGEPHTEIVSTPRTDYQLHLGSIPLYVDEGPATVAGLLSRLPDHYLFEDEDGLFVVSVSDLIDIEPLPET